jgi:Trypsin-co-occurring domain 2
MGANEGGGAPEPGFVGLAEVIRQIRGELDLARGQRAGSPIGFTVDKVSLEFTVQVHKSGTGKGGLRIGVVTAELGGSVDRSTTHRVQVELNPTWNENDRLSLSRPDGGTGGEGGTDETGWGDEAADWGH